MEKTPDIDCQCPHATCGARSLDSASWEITVELGTNSLLVPRGQISFAQQHFRGPCSKVNRQGDSVSTVGTEDDHSVAAGMVLEDWAPLVRDQNRPTPFVTEANAG
jgi:hypothetical protein